MCEFFGLTDEQLLLANQFFSESKNYRDVADRGAYIDLLLGTPGIDPVLAVADGHPEDIPEEGWLVASHIAPGYGGVVNIYRYSRDSFNLAGSVSDTREEYGQVRVPFELRNTYGQHIIAYENSTYPNKTTEPYERVSQASYTGLGFENTELIPLNNGGRLLDEKGRMSERGNGSWFQLDWHDWSEDRRREYSPDMVVNRVVEDPERLGEVLVYLASGMGLKDKDIVLFVSTIGQKIAD